MKKNKKFFSPNFMAEFKKWITEDNQETPALVKGQHIQASSTLKHIVEKIDCIDVGENTVLEVAKYFIRHGGVVKEVQDGQVTIKNKKGIFMLPAQDLNGE